MRCLASIFVSVRAAAVEAAYCGQHRQDDLLDISPSSRRLQPPKRGCTRHRSFGTSHRSGACSSAIGDGVQVGIRVQSSRIDCELEDAA